MPRLIQTWTRYSHLNIGVFNFDWLIACFMHALDGITLEYLASYSLAQASVPVELLRTLPVDSEGKQ